MQIITTPHYNRPNCTESMIKYLRKAVGIADWHVIFVCEPGCENVKEYCKHANLPSYEVIVNNRLLGLWENKKKCLDIAFNQRNADFVLHLEDDILISNDALLFYEWCNHTYLNQSQVFTVNGFNKIRAFDFYARRCPCCNMPFYTQIYRRLTYNSIGFAIWKDRYHSMVLNNDWNGSDLSLENYRNKYNLFEVYPILSRINHIGHQQGTSFDDDVAITLIKQGIKPECLVGSTPDKLQWATNRPTLLTNELGNEWVKLNDSKCRSRKELSFYKEHVYLDFWAGNCTYQCTGFFE